MKRILIAANVLLLGIVFFLLSSASDQGKLHAQPPGAEQKGSGTFGRPVFMNANDTDKAGYINYDLAVQLSHAYKNGAARVRYGTSMVPDASCIYFSLPTLKNFIATIENSVSQRCSPSLGIRFYYIRYPSDMSSNRGLSGLHPDVANHHSLMMVPVYEKDGSYIDFNTSEIGTDSCAPIPYYQTSSESKRIANILLMNTYHLSPRTGTALIQNHGGLTPPPDDETGTFPTPAGSFKKAILKLN